MKRTNTDLPQRLRAEADTILMIRQESPGYGTSTYLLKDAADTIESLQAEVERLQGELARYYRLGRAT